MGRAVEVIGHEMGRFVGRLHHIGPAYSDVYGSPKYVTVAFVELDDGRLVEVRPCHIRFLDRKEPTDAER